MRGSHALKNSVKKYQDAKEGRKPENSKGNISKIKLLNIISDARVAGFPSFSILLELCTAKKITHESQIAGRSVLKYEKERQKRKRPTNEDQGAFQPPDRPFDNFRASKSVDWRNLCSAETSINGY